MHQRRQTQIHIARVGSKEHMLTAHPARLLFKLSTRKWAAKKKYHRENWKSARQKRTEAEQIQL